MRRWLRGIFILWIVLRYGLDQLALDSFRHPWLRVLARDVSLALERDVAHEVGEGVGRVAVGVAPRELVGKVIEKVAKADGVRQTKDFDQGCMSTYCPDQNSSLTQHPSDFPAFAVERDEIFGLSCFRD